MQALAARRDYLNAKRYDALKYRGTWHRSHHRPCTRTLLGERAIVELARAFRSRPIFRPRKCSRCRTRIAWSGIVRSSKPLSYGGTLIENFTHALRGRPHRPRDGGSRRSDPQTADRHRSRFGQAWRSGARARTTRRSRSLACCSTTRSSTRTRPAMLRSVPRTSSPSAGGETMSDDEFERRRRQPQRDARGLHDWIGRARHRRRARERPHRAADAPGRLGGCRLTRELDNCNLVIEYRLS